MKHSCPACGYNRKAPIGGSWTFFVDRQPKSANRRLINQGPGRWAYAAERKAWLDEFMIAMVNHRIPPATGKRRVTIVRLIDGRMSEFDYGNFVSGLKPCLDAMVVKQLIVDDDPDSLEDYYRQQPGTPSGCMFLIEELL